MDGADISRHIGTGGFSSSRAPDRPRAPEAADIFSLILNVLERLKERVDALAHAADFPVEETAVSGLPEASEQAPLDQLFAARGRL
jgi:hypothetical protein